MTRLRSVPHVGRYRLYDRSGQRYRCRVCGLSFRDGHLERHSQREIRNLGAEEAVRRIQLRLTKRGKVRWKRRTQFYHEKTLAMAGLELDPRKGPPPQGGNS